MAYSIDAPSFEKRTLSGNGLPATDENLRLKNCKQVRLGETSVPTIYLGEALVFGRRKVRATFKSWDGTVVSVLSGFSGDALSAPDEPARDGYYGTGWSPAVPDKFPDADAEYSAQYRENPTARFWTSPNAGPGDPVYYCQDGILPGPFGMILAGKDIIGEDILRVVEVACPSYGSSGMYLRSDVPSTNGPSGAWSSGQKYVSGYDDSKTLGDGMNEKEEWKKSGNDHGYKFLKAVLNGNYPYGFVPSLHDLTQVCNYRNNFNRYASQSGGKLQIGYYTHLLSSKTTYYNDYYGYNSRELAWYMTAGYKDTDSEDAVTRDDYPVLICHLLEFKGLDFNGNKTYDWYSGWSME